MEPSEAARAIRLKAIRRRDEDAAGSTSAAALDRRWLLGEVDRLKTALERATENDKDITP